ncbi:hypothetical protein CHELA17_62481 [Chelatococcus asaccharovorans]|nr:hypothetical protein CHELA17_62481 [Chelatococcus asaccharovorans]
MPRPSRLSTVASCWTPTRPMPRSRPPSASGRGAAIMPLATRPAISSAGKVSSSSRSSARRAACIDSLCAMASMDGGGEAGWRFCKTAVIAMSYSTDFAWVPGLCLGDGARPGWRWRALDSLAEYAQIRGLNARGSDTGSGDCRWPAAWLALPMGWNATARKLFDSLFSVNDDAPEREASAGARKWARGGWMMRTW